jgi:amidase
MAGPDPLTAGVAYDVALPPARHERLGDFRVLVLAEHPLIPTRSAVRVGVNRVADALADGGARVERHTPLLPDLTEAAALYMYFLFSGSVARFLDEVRLRGMVSSHRDWTEANNRRELHRHGWRQLFAEFDVVVCPITPTPAFPHDHNPDPLARRIDIDGAEHPYFDQLVRAGLAPCQVCPPPPYPRAAPRKACRWAYSSPNCSSSRSAASSHRSRRTATDEVGMTHEG